MNWKQQDGWNKHGDRAHRKPRVRGKPTAPAKDDSGELSTWEASKKRSEKRHKRRTATLIATGAALVLLLLVAALPTIASVFAPGVIASKATDAIAGRVEVGAVRLGWFGSQQVQNVRLFDDKGEQRGEITAKSDKGLLGLLLAGGNYGTITLSGELDASTDADGRTFLQHTLGVKPGDKQSTTPGAASPPPSPAPPAMPSGLRATVRLDDLRVIYAGPTSDAVRVDQLRGEISLPGGGRAKIDLHAKVQRKKNGAALFDDAGTLGITADAADLTDPDGAINTTGFSLDAKVEARDIASSLLDLLPDFAGRGEAALGPTISATIEADGPANALAVTLTTDSDSVSANAPLVVDLIAGSLKSSGRITASLDSGRLSMLMPDRDALLGPDADLHVTEYPGVDIAIENLSLPIPPADTADLRGSGAKLLVKLGASAASVRTPGIESRRNVGFLPATVTLDAPDLAGTVTLRTDLNTTVGGEASGTLKVDLAAEDLLDDTGSISAASPPTIRGEVKAEQLILAAFQPIAAAAGFDLTGVIGETADMTLTAAPAADTQDPAARATTLRLAARADHAQINGSVRLDQDSIRATGDGITARFDRLAPLMAEALAASGVDIEQASGATIDIPELSIDLAAAGRGDLSSVRLVADAGLGAVGGVFADSGDRVGAKGLTLRAEAAPLSSGVRVRASGGLLFNGSDAGRLAADLTAAGLLSDDGAPLGGVPARVSGTARLTGVRTAAVQPLLDSTPLVLDKDIGPVLDVTLTAEADTAGGAAGPTTDITIAARADRLDAGGVLRLLADRVESDALHLDLAGIDGPLARVARLPEGARLGGNPAAAVVVENLMLPLDGATRRPDAAQASGTIRATLNNLTISAATGETTAVPSLSATTTLAPGQDPAISITGDVRTSDKAGTIGGEMTLRNAFEPIDAEGRLVAAPVGTVSLRRIPARVLALTGVRLPRPDADEIGLDEFVINASGGWLSATVTTSVDDRGALHADTELKTPRHKAVLAADLAPRAGGGFDVLSVEGDADLKLSQPTARQVLQLLRPRREALVEIPEPGRLAMHLTTDKDGTARGTLKLEPVTVGGPVLGGGGRLDPMRLAAGASLAVPLAALTGDDAAHAVSLTADVNADRDGDDVLALKASAGGAIRALKPAGGMTADVNVSSTDTALLDTIAGAGGKLAEALGERVRLSAVVESPDPASPGDLKAEVKVDSPRLKTRSPIRLVRTGETVALTSPAEIRWRLTTRMFDTLAPTREGKAAQVRLRDGIWWTLKADEMRFEQSGAGLVLRSSIDAPKIPLRFPDGSNYTYTDLHATLNTLDRPGSARLRLSAVDPDRPDADAVSLNTTVLGLPDGGEDWTPGNIVLTGEFGLDGFPVRLVDALAMGQGDLVDLLGPALDLDAHIKNMPRKGGTFTFDAETAQAKSEIRATVRPHPADAGVLAVTLDKPMHTELTHFRYDIKGKKIALLPVFATIVKVEGSDRPATIDIDRLALPVDGDVKMIVMDGSVDPGVVEYEFDRGLALLLDITKLRKQGKAGERLEPFTIAMHDGVASFDDLAVPIGEFTVQARGKIDLVNKREDIVLGVPAGAFAQEVIGKLPGAGGTLNGDVIVPVRRSGPLGQDNPWQPDFEAVLGNLFENLLRGGLDQLLKQGKD